MPSQSGNKDGDAKSSPEDNKTEAMDGVSGSPGLGEDGSATDRNRTFYVPRCGLIFCIMASGGFFCSFALRVGLSVTIVAMVNQTAVAEEVAETNTSDADQCPRDPALLREGGEFTWDRYQQGAVLAAFYYGNLLSQV